MQSLDILEERIYGLINKNKMLIDQNQKAREDIAEAKAENERLNAKVNQLESNNKSLRAVNAMLGSKENKRETKLQINSLIKEIDQCIVQLSE